MLAVPSQSKPWAPSTEEERMDRRGRATRSCGWKIHRSRCVEVWKSDILALLPPLSAPESSLPLPLLVNAARCPPPDGSGCGGDAAILWRPPEGRGDGRQRRSGRQQVSGGAGWGTEPLPVWCYGERRARVVRAYPARKRRGTRRARPARLDGPSGLPGRDGPGRLIFSPPRVLISSSSYPFFLPAPAERR